MQVLALQPNNRQAQEELRSLRDLPEDMDAEPAPQGPGMQELYQM